MSSMVAPAVERRTRWRAPRGASRSLATALVTLAAGGVVMALSGADPVATYKAILEGAGFSWLLPWTTGTEREIAATNLQQTLLLATPLVLTGLAVAYAFKAGLFNVGAQGQYLVGSLVAVWLGEAIGGLAGPLHVGLVVAAGTLAGAFWGGLAGWLRSATGASEVITTIMLNYIALWIGLWLLGVGGPLQDPGQPSIPVSADIEPSAQLPVIWGEASFQGLHVGIFVSLAALAGYWLALQRTVGGYETRTIGSNPDAGEYAGMSAARKYVRVMLACGALAGLAGVLDVTGWEYRLAATDVQTSTVGYLGIAVALLGRNSAIGVAAAALLFGVLLNGTSTRNLDPAVFEPELATGLTLMIQGLIVLLVSAPLLTARFGRRR